MWFTELVAIVGFSVVIPLLPLYVRDLGVVGERQVAMWSGAVFSSQAVTMAIFAPIWGALSDRYGRKVMVERAMYGGTVIMALMGLARSPFQLIVLRAIQGALTGTVTASRALVATTAPKDRAGYALGTLQVAVYIGATAGPLLGGVMADAVGYRTPFFVTRALLLIAATAVAIVVREPRRSTQVLANPDGARSHGRRTLRDQVLNHLRPVLDSAPILERSFAYEAGLGFIGKNNMLIIPGYGSYFFLAEILTTVLFEAPEKRSMAHRCGNCTRCMDACPTGALKASFSLDASRCLSYLTIEYRGGLPDGTGRKMGNCFFGCDACQEVCPFNEGEPRKEVCLPHTQEILRMSENNFQKEFGKTAFARSGLEKLKSNIRALRVDGSERHTYI
jgi:MFS family permease